VVDFCQHGRALRCQLLIDVSAHVTNDACLSTTKIARRVAFRTQDATLGTCP
jgi:hypothetical protein